MIESTSKRPLLTAARWLMLIYVAALPIVRPLDTRILGVHVFATDLIFAAAFLFWLASGLTRKPWFDRKYAGFGGAFFLTFVVSAVFSTEPQRSLLKLTGVFYLLAVLLHAVWNLLVTSREEAYWALAVLILIAYVVFIFIIFIRGIMEERRQRSVVLVEEFELGVLPTEHREILMSYRAMRKGSWFPEYLNKDKYLALVGRLVLRKVSYLRSKGGRQSALQKEIVELRRELKRFSELFQELKREKPITEAR